MMGPHWNPKSHEIAIVLQGQGMIQVVCPGIAKETGCKNSRLRVNEGDVFVVPRYHPMAQMSFNNDSFVFMGFMLKVKKESPQYLKGKYSILKKLDRKVLEKSFNVKMTTIDRVLSDKKERVIYECTSCAEVEEAGKEEEEGGGSEGGGTAMPPKERVRWQQEEEGGGGGWWPKEANIHIY